MEHVQSITDPGSKECKEQGNILSWEKAKFDDDPLKNTLISAFSGSGPDPKNTTWSLYGKTLTKTLHENEGPCNRRKNVIVFSKRHMSVHDCMGQCLKIGSRSPSLNSQQQWQSLSQELKDRQNFDPKLGFLLSVTQGSVENDHLPKNSNVEKGFLRDYYTGETIDNFTKPWWPEDKKVLNVTKK